MENEVMWIFTLDGFYSVVEDARNKDFVYARGRDAGDIDRLCKRIGTGAKRIDTPQSDYPFRARLRKKSWRRYVNMAVADLKYTNFKDAIGNKKDGWNRELIMLRIWSSIIDAFGGERKWASSSFLNGNERRR
jgi:hypothetical protein